MRRSNMNSSEANSFTSIAQQRDHSSVCPQKIYGIQMISDLPCCWPISEHVAFPGHHRSVFVPDESFDCFAAHGCSAGDSRSNASTLGRPVDLFGNGVGETCTCVQHNNNNNNNNISSSNNNRCSKFSRELVDVDISNRSVPGNPTSRNLCFTCSSGSAGCQDTLPSYLATRPQPHHSLLSAHAGPTDGAQRSSGGRLEDLGKEANASHSEATEFKEKLPRPVQNDMESKERSRGKKLLCPKNATPLYGKVPSWWGDSYNEKKSPPSVDQAAHKAVPSSRQTSSSNKKSEISESQVVGPDKEKRRQSTAFVVSMENSGQSTPMTLSNSLPSFQIDDHLCSYFPASRRMSFQKREAAMRRKPSIELERTPSSDVASESGTYVVELDVDDDIYSEYDDSPRVVQEDVVLDGKLNTSRRVACRPKDFRPALRLSAAECKGIGASDERKTSQKGTKSFPKKVNRKKTFVVSPDPQIAPDKTRTESTKLNSPREKHTNPVPFESSFAREDTETPSPGTADSTAPKFEDNFLDTRQLSKESSWNFNSSESFKENMEYTTSFLKMDSPKVINRPKWDQSKSKMNINNISLYNSLGQTDLSPSELNSDNVNGNFYKLDDKDQIECNREAALDENESCLLTTRSMKTELLLRPTEEITNQLRKSKNFSKPRNMPSTDHKRKITMLLRDGDSKSDNSKNGDNIFMLQNNSYELTEGESNEQGSFTNGYRKDLGSPSSDESTDNSRSEAHTGTDLNILTKNSRLDSNNLHNGIKDTRSIGIEDKECKKPDSIFSCSTESTIESSRSKCTDLSLGQKIVQLSRSISSASSEKSQRSFVPPHKKQVDASLQRVTSSSSISSIKKGVPRSRTSESRRVQEVQSKQTKIHEGRNSSTGKNTRELSIRGSSVYSRSSVPGVAHQQKNKEKQNLENRQMPDKQSQGCDNISCLTGIMKYSAQIQLLSGNLLELISLKKERKAAWMATDHKMVDFTVSSRLNSTLSTMRASNNLLFDLHDFLITEMEKL